MQTEKNEVNESEYEDLMDFMLKKIDNLLAKNNKNDTKIDH